MKKVFLLLAVIAVAGFVAVPTFGADKLIVQDSGGTNTVFVVQDTGMVGFGNAAPTEFVDVVGNGVSTSFRLTKFGGNPGAVFRAAGGTLAAPTQVLANGLLGGFVGAGYTNAGSFSPNKVGLYFRASDNFSSTAQGTYMTFETTTAGTTQKISRMTLNDAGLNVVGTISQTSSRDYKDHIEELTSDKAMEALKNLSPVTFNYKNDDQGHVGFIAEDVPDLVASKDRKSLSPMDVVAVLTKVVQEQNKVIEALSAKIDMIERASKKE